MKDPLGMWMMDNAELFRYAAELPCMKERADRILLSGAASAFLAPLYRRLYPDAVIDAVLCGRWGVEYAYNILQGNEVEDGATIDLPGFIVNYQNFDETAPNAYSYGDLT